MYFRRLKFVNDRLLRTCLSLAPNTCPFIIISTGTDINKELMKSVHKCDVIWIYATTIYLIDVNFVQDKFFRFVREPGQGKVLLLTKKLSLCNLSMGTWRVT